MEQITNSMSTLAQWALDTLSAVLFDIAQSAFLGYAMAASFLIVAAVYFYEVINGSSEQPERTMAPLEPYVHGADTFQRAPEHHIL